MRLGVYPTPLQSCDRLSAHLGIRLLIKREDAAPLALGGNKVRKLELILGQALAEGADAIITSGSVQSNHCRLTAAACAKLGLPCFLILRGAAGAALRGNLLLDRLFGARITSVGYDDKPAAEAEMLRLADELRAAGHHPFVVPAGGTLVESVAAFMECATEIGAQTRVLGATPGTVVVACGSATTFVGLWLGMRTVASDARVLGVTVAERLEAARIRIDSILEAIKPVIPVDAAGEPWLTDHYLGEGYAVPTSEGIAAVRLAAEQEGLLLDLTYTGKAFAGLLGELAGGRINRQQGVVFVHTGGVPDLFARDAGLLVASDVVPFEGEQ